MLWLFAGFALSALALALCVPEDAWLLFGSGLYFVPALFLLLGTFGEIGRGYGVHNLFREDERIFFRSTVPDGKRVSPVRLWGQLPFVSRTLASPAFWSGAGFAAAFGYGLIIAYAATPGTSCEGEACSRLLFLAQNAPEPFRDTAWPPAALLVVACILFLVLTGIELACPLADLERRRPWDVVRELARTAIGLAAGVVFARAALSWATAERPREWSEFLLGSPLPLPESLLGRLVLTLLLILGLTWSLRAIRGGDNWVTGAFGVASGCLILAALLILGVQASATHGPLLLVAWFFTIPVVVAFVLRTTLPVMSMAVIGLSLMSLGIVVPAIYDEIAGATWHPFGFLDAVLPPGYDEIATTGILNLFVVALVLLATFLCINGWRFRYRIDGFDYERPKNPQAVPSTPSSGDDASTNLPELANPSARLATASGKLVVLCLSGGAYRASFWSSLLIDHLQDRQPDFEERVHLVTGASGGMVAGAYLVAKRAKGLTEPVTKLIEEDTLAVMRDEGRAFPVSRDSLSAVAHQLAQWDLRDLVVPGRPGTDRGVTLESQWKIADLAFSDLTKDQCPAIILSPMLIETGCPALFSNIDLKGIRLPWGTDAKDFDANKTSVEVFREFPDAFEKLKLATAVRLNATFPYVSPGVSLPTIPERRAVDAGYYDGHGVDIATDYLDADIVFNAIAARPEITGVAVVQVRAFPTDQPTPKTNPLARALQFLTSPLEGVSIARRMSQIFRNDQELASVARRYNEASPQLRCPDHPEVAYAKAGLCPEPECKKLLKGEAFFQTFTFEASVDISMSWYTRDDEMRALRTLLTPLTDAERRQWYADMEEKVAAEETAEQLQAGKLTARKRKRRDDRVKIGGEINRLLDFLRT